MTQTIEKMVITENTMQHFLVTKVLQPLTVYLQVLLEQMVGAQVKLKILPPTI